MQFIFIFGGLFCFSLYICELVIFQLISDDIDLGLKIFYFVCGILNLYTTIESFYFIRKSIRSYLIKRNIDKLMKELTKARIAMNLSRFELLEDQILAGLEELNKIYKKKK
jgi:hypothetical protein